MLHTMSNDTQGKLKADDEAGVEEKRGQEEEDKPRIDAPAPPPPPRRKDGHLYVAKNSLTEEELLKARDAARARVQGKKREDVSEADAEAERRASNRLASFQSRKRRKANMSELEKTVKELEKVNQGQRKQMNEQSDRLQSAKRENERLRQSLSSQQKGGVQEVSLPQQNVQTQATSATQASGHQDKQQRSQDTSVFDILAKLDEHRENHNTKVNEQERKHKEDQQVLNARHKQQKQLLVSGQSEQLKQMDADHKDEAKKLAKAQDDETIRIVNSWGLPVESHGDVVRLFQEMSNSRQQEQQGSGSTQSGTATATVTTTATASRPSLPPPPPQAALPPMNQTQILAMIQRLNDQDQTRSKSSGAK